jgi:branched-chain amino acid transport system substrate-binding protein
MEHRSQGLAKASTSTESTVTTANDIQTATEAGLASSRRGLLRGAAALTAVAALARASLAWAADKDTIKIGYISPRTGPFSPFAEADDFILDQTTRAARIANPTWPPN